MSFVEEFQTRGFEFEVRGILENQTEKLKRFRELGIGKKPALKFEFGDMRVLFCDGSHGESEILKEVICWEIEG